MGDNIIRIKNDIGDLEDYKVLFTFECEELGKSYVAYETENGISAAIYTGEDNLVKLEPITNIDELKMVESVLNEIVGSEF